MNAICPQCLIVYDSLIEANICRIGDLLQHSLDKDKSAAPTTPAFTGLICVVCGLRCKQPATMMAHAKETGHTEALAQLET